MGFGAVRFAALLFNEAQLVKNPGIRLTHALKSVNAEFRIAMTGTPVENRLADLWSIVDGVAAGHLGTLKDFSARYEAGPNAASLEQLKASLDRPLGGRPPLLLRRLSREQLPDLPERVPDRIVRAPMQGAQLAAYAAALAMARKDRPQGDEWEQRKGSVLAALQRLRAASLWCDPGADADDAALIAGSVRLGLSLDVLDAVAARRERALLFLEDLTLMARLSGLLQRRYRLPEPPMTINGTVAGGTRQARVDRFQRATDGFDVMLLSPKAGGVGLTLTRANHVVHLNRWWNPATEDQCTGRVLRIGQTLPVTVHLPQAVLPDGRRSFDENLHDLLERKRRLMHDALVSPEFGPADYEAVLDASLG